MANSDFVQVRDIHSHDQIINIRHIIRVHRTRAVPERWAVVLTEDNGIAVDETTAFALLKRLLDQRELNIQSGTSEGEPGTSM